DLEKPGEHLHRPAARVHEALRQQEPGTGRIVAADERLEFAVLAQHYAARLGEALDQPEAGVVPRALVLLARVAQADNEADGHALFLLFLLALVRGCRLLCALGRRSLVAALGGSAFFCALAFLRRDGLLGRGNLRRRYCAA